MSRFRSGLALAACLASLPSLPSAQDPEADFHRAYFLERERGALAEALALYEGVAASRAAGAELQAQATERAAGLREDLASADLARLMPPETIAYAELARPGEALRRLLAQLGLTGSFEQAAASGGFALRPELLEALFGIRGLALGLTRLPAGGAAPGGVLVVHAGEHEILRGLIEAGVLVQGTPAEPIEGVASWTLEQEVHVAVTRRLVIASTEREEIAGVLRRLSGREEESLATSPALREHLAGRERSPLTLCANAVPLRPVLRSLLAAQANDPRAALAAAALDLDSLEAFVARLAVTDDGLALEADLHLAKGHRNLVFNLLRKAPLDPALLERIPEGVALFAAGACNERGPAIAPLERNADGAPVVTALDFGRELFANLAGFALFVMPGGAPIPNAALVLSSNDPARTGAVLGLVLGLGNALVSGQSIDGAPSEIGGAPTRVFQLPPGIPLYVTTHENTLILSPSRDAIEEALDGRTSGNSVLHDEAFAAELGRLGKDTTFALCAHLGRALETAQPYLPPQPRGDLARFAPLLERTVLAIQEHHSETRLGFALALHGLPRVDGLVVEALKSRRGGHAVAARELGALPLVAHEGLAQRFERLAQERDGGAAARGFAREQMKGIADDPRALNNFAWALLTEARFGQRFDDVAREYAQAANDASGHSVWQYLDTLALAQFRAGAVREAIALEERALQHAQSSEDRAALEASLTRFRDAAAALAADTHPR